MNNKNGNKIYEMPKYQIYEPEVRRVVVNEAKRTVVVELVGGEKGKAKCCENDIFSEKIGYEVAYAKAKIKEAKHEISFYENFIKGI